MTEAGKPIPGDVTIRALARADSGLLSGIAELMIVAWARQPSAQEVQERVARLREQLRGLDPDEAALFIAQRAGGIVGFGRVTRDSKDPSHWWLSGLVVHPQHRRQGIGRAMTQARIDHARLRGARCIRCETHMDNAASIRYHESLGFARGDAFAAGDGDMVVPFQLAL